MPLDRTISLANDVVARMSSPVVICGALDAAASLDNVTTRMQVDGVLSISDPHHYRNAVRPPDAILDLFAPNTLLLNFRDTFRERDGGPTEEDAQRVLEWGARMRPHFNNPQHPRKVLIHCYMGISRSTAAAYICFCQVLGRGAEQQALEMTRNSSAELCLYESGIKPNELLVEHADKILGRNGRMIAALE
jgi:predicted protein tyrosine phosphatase